MAGSSSSRRDPLAKVDAIDVARLGSEGFVMECHGSKSSPELERALKPSAQGVEMRLVWLLYSCCIGRLHVAAVRLKNDLHFIGIKFY